MKNNDINQIFYSLLFQVSALIFSVPSFSGPCPDKLIRENLSKETSRLELQPNDMEIQGILQNYRPCCEPGASAVLSYRLPHQKTYWVDCALLNLSSGEPVSSSDDSLSLKEAALTPQKCESKKTDEKGLKELASDCIKVAKIVDFTGKEGAVGKGFEPTSVKEQIQGNSFMVRLTQKDQKEARAASKVIKDYFPRSDRESFTQVNQEFIRSLQIKKSRDQNKVEQNLMKLEMAGLGIEELKKASQIFGRDKKGRDAFVNLLSSRALMRPEMSHIVNEFVKISLMRQDQPFKVSLQDISGSPAGLGIARWSPSAQQGMGNVLRRTLEILERTPSKKINDAFQEAEKELGILGKNKNCSLCS